MADTTWVTGGTLVTPRGLVRGALGFRNGRIASVGGKPARGDARIDVRGRYVAPGLIDLHIWGEPQRVARDIVRTGTTAFLHAIGPEPPEMLANRLVQFNGVPVVGGARCLGIHLEGPFLNPLRAGALASRWLRPPTSRELRQLHACSQGRLRLITLAPEIPRGLESIRWCARHGIVVALGHSDADGAIAQRAAKAGARVVTHVFNGMRPLHHRDPGLLGEVLTDDRLTATVILDGVHVHPVAFQMLLRCKGPQGIVLVTDSIRHHHRTWEARLSGGAYRLKSGTIAGSRLTLIGAVRNAVKFGKVSLAEAVQMASLNPTRVLGESDRLGSLEVGKQADLVVFDEQFRVSMTFVNGKIVYRR
jgi:N-acetylglucosamine-6-phosphate deacetylase